VVFTYFNETEIWKLEALECQHKEDNTCEGEAKQLLFKDLGINYKIDKRFEPLEEDKELYELYEGIENNYNSEDSDEEEDKPPVNESISSNSDAIHAIPPIA